MPKKKEEIKEEVAEAPAEAPKGIDKLAITFQTEDLNKLVAKVNEIIEKHG